MLGAQLASALGKAVTAKDFADFMSIHSRKMFKPEFAPKPFVRSVRLPGRDPEGTVSLLAPNGEEVMTTTASRVNVSTPMFIPINAASRLEFYGDRHVHGMIQHAFGKGAGASGGRGLSLEARAKRFSAFVIVVGTLRDGGELDPKAALIVQDKDEAILALVTETIPTAGEFRDAIESLSPEQQRFARAIRSLQLASTLFAFAVIQIKPQLERVLNLGEGALTKEIKLTRTVMELLGEYQIPSDMISFSGDEAASNADRVASVRESAEGLQKMISDEKAAELALRKQQNAFARGGDDSDDEPEMAFGGGGKGGRKGGGAFGAPQQRSMKNRSMAPPFLATPMAAAAAPPPMAVATFGAAPFGAAPPPPPPGGPPPPPQQQQQEAAAPEGSTAAATSDAGARGGDGDDYTSLPGALDAAFDRLGENNALRATIIKPGNNWRRTMQRTLLGEPKRDVLAIGYDTERAEKNKALDLLDALSRSGSLSALHAEIHVVLAATHFFDSTLVDTVVRGNVNPVERVERSATVITSVIHSTAPELLLEPEHAARMRELEPLLFERE